MGRIIALLLVFIFGCSPKIFAEKEVTLRSLDAKVKNVSCKRAVKLGDIELSDRLATEKILYKEGDKFGYFSKNKWICAPDCMLRYLLLRNFSCFGRNGSTEINLEVLDLYADFSGNNPKVVLSVKAELKEGNCYRTKIFHFEKETENTEEAIFRAFNKVTREFLEELGIWMKKSCKVKLERG